VVGLGSTPQSLSGRIVRGWRVASWRVWASSFLRPRLGREHGARPIRRYQLDLARRGTVRKGGYKPVPSDRINPDWAGDDVADLGAIMHPYGRWLSRGCHVMPGPGTTIAWKAPYSVAGRVTNPAHATMSPSSLALDETSTVGQPIERTASPLIGVVTGGHPFYVAFVRGNAPARS